ncbi:hypothetical protein [Geothrix alkalitolerans]|uniref:hypothetical protein n=1 Tax=Geothrix alkalitolerans TaxID=2922724 RepID=UPI001FAEAA07|nr:hypothetical protein [Geothrix alkalitolerans]
MKRATAEKLLGGYATGTLTAEERRTLFEAALAHQDLFDALADEEALRELLADPAARAQVLAALAAPDPASVKVVPFWRRPGVLGAAAGVLMASLAGLTWLRNPQTPPPAQEAPTPAQEVPPSVRQAPASPKALSFEAAPEGPTEPAAGSRLERRAPAQTPPNPKKAPAQEATPPPAAGISAGAASAPAAPPPPPVPVPVPVAAPAPRPVPVVQDHAQGAVAAPQDRLTSQDRLAPQAVTEALSAAPPAPTPARAKAAKLAKAEGWSSGATALAVPTWTLTPQADGTTLVTVTAPPQTQVWLLRRGGGGVEVLQDRAVALQEAREAQRRYLVRLKAGDALDLYALAHPVADPAKLPEAGPLAGFRARIFPSEKKDPDR